LGAVEHAHQVTVGGSGCVELVVSLLQLVGQVEQALFEFEAAVFELGGAVRGADSAGLVSMDAEGVGQSALQGLDVSGKASVLRVQGDVSSSGHH
jgi:hypothetical protein